ncbi:MAG: hypothetical protein V3S20_08475 [Dehalococcoidia bacterium]
MSGARYPLPTDLVALMTHDGRVYPNEAKTWDRMGSSDGGPHPLGTALEQWFSFATGKHTWVSVRGATIRGLVSARRRAKRSAWEVDCLINADDDCSVTQSLLERMIAGVAKQRAERVFLRLPTESAIVDIARGAGFFPYAYETLYRADEPAPAEDPGLPLRPASKADAFGIYQLYSAVTPANVRAIEGATFREWQASLEHWGSTPNDLVLEEDGIITGWLRLLAGNEGRFSILVHPERRDANAFLQSALARLRGSRSVLCLIPSHGDSLSRQLRRLAFNTVEDYVAMAKRLAKHTGELAAETEGAAVTAS